MEKEELLEKIRSQAEQIRDLKDQILEFRQEIMEDFQTMFNQSSPLDHSASGFRL